MKAADAGFEALLGLIEPLARERNELKERLAEIEAEIAPLEAAAKQLKSKGKAKAKTKNKAGKRSVRKSDVHTVCLKLVEENPAITQSELKDRAKEKLAGDLGLDLKGFELRFKEAMATDEFDVTTGGAVSLAEMHPIDPPHLNREAAGLPVDKFELGGEFD